MAIITIDSGAFCHGTETAEKVAEKLGYEVLPEASVTALAVQRFGISDKKLQRTLSGGSSLFSSPERERPRAHAYMRAVLAAQIKRDNLVYVGLGGYFLPRSLTHVLKVCLAAPRSYRIAQAVAKGVAEREAERQISRDDEARAAWTHELFGSGPWDSELFDIFIPMDDNSADDAVAIICENASKPAVATTRHARRAVDDFAVAAAVQVALAERGHDVDVSCSGGKVTILINRYTMFLDRHARELTSVAADVDGVASASARPGPRYREPSVGFNLDVDVPSKVLLVDDEREFVHTLSERLQSRAMSPAIAYDGEQALAMVEADQPEVMVLDLKMPGIDGLEVLRRVKRSHPSTEVIILTGHGSDAEERLANDLGAFAYLRKPVDIEVLAKTMRDAYRKVSATEVGNAPE